MAEVIAVPVVATRALAVPAVVLMVLVGVSERVGTEIMIPDVVMNSRRKEQSWINKTEKSVSPPMIELLLGQENKTENSFFTFYQS